ncbi:MAG: DUF1801 domain-containing protein [Tabrizicola sp.]|nr:DUF1801 domain-containing protein [Tabrizicola sp.]
MSTSENTQQIADALCALIGGALPAAKQTTKWNAPNFEIDNRDMITLNFSPKHPVRIVFHSGAKAVDTKTGNRIAKDESGRLTWATDQRAYMSFRDLDDIQTNAAWLTDFCKTWVDAVRKLPA